MKELHDCFGGLGELELIFFFSPGHQYQARSNQPLYATISSRELFTAAARNPSTIPSISARFSASTLGVNSSLDFSTSQLHSMPLV